MEVRRGRFRLRAKKRPPPGVLPPPDRAKVTGPVASPPPPRYPHAELLLNTSHREESDHDTPGPADAPGGWGGGAGGAAGAGLTGLPGRSGRAAASERIRVAVIGLRSRGTDHAQMFAANPGAEVVAVCDIDDAMFAKPIKAVEAKGGKAPRVEKDFRR